MTPLPIGASAYGTPPVQANTARRADLAHLQQDVSRALNAEGGKANSQSNGAQQSVTGATHAAQSQPLLGRHIDVLA